MSRGAPLRVSRVLVWLLVSLASVLVADLAVVRFGGLTGLGDLEVLAQDFRQRGTIETRSGEGDRPTDIVLVFFDPESVAEWPYREPFPRAVLADLIDALTDVGAAAIGLDVFLADTFPALNALDQGDQRLRAAIERAGNVVVVSGTEFDDGTPRLAAPHPYFTEVGATVSSADVPDAFERLGDVGLVTRDGDGLAPGFALALWATARGLDVDSLMAAAQERGFVDLPGIPRSVSSLPNSWVDGTARVDDAILPLPIDFVGPPSHPSAAGAGVEPTFPSFSASLVPTLALFSPEFFADKIVLMGTSDHFYDRFRTPLSGYRDTGADAAVGVAAEAAGAGDGMAPPAAEAVPADADLTPDRAAYQWMYGVEVHANALQNILDGEYLLPVDRDATVGIMAVAALASVGAVFWIGTAWGGLVTLLLGLGMVGLSFWVWVEGTVMLPVVAPLFAGGVSYVGASAWVAVVEGREKRFIQGAFGKYVSPDVVASIADNPEALQLGGQKRMLSILFSDLSGFTTLSERLDPQDLLAHLNDYLTDMTQVVMDEQGTLDKYIGDAIMAFWNAPADVPDHAERALRTAVLMQRKMNELNARWAAEDGGEALLVRIGVNTGEVVVGNVGGKNRFDYSAIGDPVNLAARLEPANKSYETLNMCSEFTLEHVDRDAFRLRELDLIAVKGKERPVRVFEVVELAGVDLGDAKEACLAAYQAGLARYRVHDWTGAAVEFERALENMPEDGPSRVYLERTRQNQTDPPPADWDFVVRRTVK